MSVTNLDSELATALAFLREWPTSKIQLTVIHPDKQGVLARTTGQSRAQAGDR